MATATETTAKPTKTRAVNTFKIACPECNGTDATVHLDLNDLKACRCSECDWEGSPQEAVAMLQKRAAGWMAVVRWVALASDALAGAGDVAGDDNEPTASIF